MISVICLITLILLIWFKSDAVLVYSKLFHLQNFFKINEYEEFKNTQDATVSYHLFLRSKYQKSFWVKLITCPICLAIWISFPVFFFVWWLYPQICLGSILLYYLIVKLM